MTRLPATAKDCTSRPNKFKNCCPTNKNIIINAPEAIVARADCICPPIFSFKEINIGIEPKISITANNVNVIVISSFSEMLAIEGIHLFTNVMQMDFINEPLTVEKT